MKTPEEIKKGLAFCCDSENEYIDKCERGCPYYVDGQFLCGITAMMKDALDYIDRLEERINLMMIQMCKDCGVCAYRGVSAFQSPCSECLYDEDRPMWKYEGLPEGRTGDEHEQNE